MLISSWLNAVRYRLQTQTRPTRRRPVQKRSARASEELEIRSLLTSLVAVRPNVGAFLTDGEIRNIAPQELTLQFSLGEIIDASSVSSESIQVHRAGLDGVFDTLDDVPVSIGYVGIGTAPNEVVLRFGANLPDDLYRITVKGTGTDPLTTDGGTAFNDGSDDTFHFELDLGAQVVAVDPQPVTVNANGTVTQARDQIVLYFNEDTLDTASAQNPAFYQLIFTRDTVSNLDDVPFNPTSVVYDSVANTAVLTFATDLAMLPGAGAGTYRLRVGNAETAPQAPVLQNVVVDPGDSFATANTVLGTISTAGNRSHLISSSIDPQPYQFIFPGALTDIGDREIEIETHVNAGADSINGTSQIPYNFRSFYGFDPLGNPLQNVITSAQKQRAREVFEFYGNYLGIDFFETDALGLTIVTGDMRALDPTIPTGPGGPVGLAGGSMAIMDQAEIWSDTPGGSWFETAMHEIGHLLGLGHSYDVPSLTVQGSNPGATVGPVEPDFPGDIDIVHGQYLHRPDSIDIDLYQFNIAANTSGTFTSELIAERLPDSSRLDSVIRLFRQNADGSRELIAQNDDYFSEDSFLQLHLSAGATPATYFLGISSVGNETYDPTIAGTGFGGTSQGAYQIRLDFRPDETLTIVDTTGQKLDGNADGTAGGVYNFWFRTAAVADTLFVNKAAITTTAASVSAGVTTFPVRSVAPFQVNDVIRVNNEQMQITGINPFTNTLTVIRGVNGSVAAAHNADVVVRKNAANGSAAVPFGRISDATAVAVPGQIIRIVGNGGADGDVSTIADNLSYQIGFNTLNQPLQDGTTLEVPRGVTMMVDAGAVLKLRRALIGVGSSSTSVDRSGGALQILGTPLNQVVFTSWNDETIGTDTSPTPTSPLPGDWGGIAFRNTVDRNQARFNFASEGQFLNYVAHADIRFGGGNVVVDSVLQTINPIYIDGAQPSILHNIITRSSDSAISANPDSFEELTFHSPRFQAGAAPFTSDYNRVGPDIYGNTLLNNSTNGLFIRVNTPAGNQTQKLTVPGRFDDTDIVHVIAQNLHIQGTPGGALRDQTPPAVNLVTLTPSIATGNLAAGTYNYRLVLTDENGVESPASGVTVTAVLNATGSIDVRGIPIATGPYNGRRLYRSTAAGTGPYTLVANLDRSTTSHLDVGTNLGRTLAAVTARDRARPDARLSIDPGIIVKLEGARIQTEMGAQFIAEGLVGRPVIFTSRLDDRYGAGGTFDTNNDDNAPTEAVPSPGNWGGIYVGHLGTASIDRSLITFAGGIIPVGGNFAGFNAVEVHQATARIRNTVFESNASGVGGTAAADRDGAFPNAAGTIFVRSAQPVVLDNDFRNNVGAAINVNATALNSRFVADPGRSTGLGDRQLGYGDNQGPLVRDNRFGGNTINGMVVRGETLTTQGVWDDTDIVHVVLNEIYIPDFQHYGGLRLESSATSSLVIKLFGPTAGFTANGYPLDIRDRVGGSLQVIGQAGHPVVMTSLRDDSVGAGFDLDDVPLRDTNGDGPSTGAPGDWRGVAILEYAHDRNVAVYVEREIADRLSQDTNGTVPTAEWLGMLATDQKSGDENLRLGFEVHGFIDNPRDTDIYSFRATAGTPVWLDIDRTTNALDSVVELLDANGQIIAISDNVGDVTVVEPGTNARLLSYDPFIPHDYYTLNALDAGFRVILPGTTGTEQPYFVRVRSSNPTPLTNFDGLTSGAYQLQIRLGELDEIPGSQITYADIRFATSGIEIIGQPAHSPMVGESTETNNITGVTSVTVGNLMNSDRAALSLAGRLGTPMLGGAPAVTTAARENPATMYDVDFWEFEVRYDATQQIGGVALTGPHVPVTIDLDFADGFSRADVTIAVYDSSNRLILIGRDSNISDDQPKSLNGADISDLSRGSNGKLDPFIGPVELISGTYRLAVFPNDIVPIAMNQYWMANPTSSLVRVEPINSVTRVVEERFGNIDTASSFLAPVTDLFTVTGGRLDPKHRVPFSLADVTLFVSSTGGRKGNDESSVFTVDPFSGTVETVLGSFGPSTEDIVMRADGQLYSFTTGPQGTALPSDGTTGNYIQIDTGTAAILSSTDDGITTNQGAPNNGAAAHDVGIQFYAMGYTGTTNLNLWAVGTRDRLTPKPGQTNVLGFMGQYSRNILYNFNLETGLVASDGGSDRTDAAVAYSGAGTTQREWGIVNNSFANGGLNGQITGMAATQNGSFYMVDDVGGLYFVNPSQVTQSVNSAGTTFIANVGIDDGNPQTGSNIQFAGLAFGPPNVEGGKYANTLFGISRQGTIYAFDTSGNLLPVFVDGQTSVATGITGATGLDFGTLDYNLWHVTGRRGSLSAADDGHGIDVPPYDDSVPMPQPGGNSLYFGFEHGANTPDPSPGDRRSAGNKNTNGNALDTAEYNNVNFPGGAHGTVVSNEFSLEGYSRDDKPVLYFNYFLETEDANYIYGTNPDTLMRDAFRVFIADESNSWNLLVTNNSLQDPVRPDEFEYGPDGNFSVAPTLQSFPDVTEVFDNTNTWRQARLDLSNYAGRSGLRLRFDFSTAGSMNVGDIETTGSELYAVGGERLTDGDTFQIDGRVFEFDLGAHLTTPSGAAAIGESFTVFGNTFQYTTTPLGPNDILALPTDSADVLAARTGAFLNQFFNGVSIVVPNGTQLEGESFTIQGQTFTYTANPLTPTDILAEAVDSADTLAARTVAVVNTILGDGTSFVNGTRVEFPGTVGITFGSSVNVPLSFPMGNQLEGESFTFLGATFTYTATPIAATDILALPGHTPATIAAAAVNVINNVLGPGTAFVDGSAAHRISIPNIPTAAQAVVTGGSLVVPAVTAVDTLQGESFTLNGVTFTFTATPSRPRDILAVLNDTADVIAARVLTALTTQFGPAVAFIDAAVPNRVSVPNITTFGNSLIRGSSLITPVGDQLQGFEFRLRNTTFRYSTSPTTATEILARPGDSAALIASRTTAAINAALGAGTAVANLDRISIPDQSVPNQGIFLGGQLTFVDAAGGNYEGESFTVLGQTFTFRDPAAPAPGPLTTFANDIDATNGETAATLAARTAAAINATLFPTLGRNVATANGAVVDIAGATNTSFGSTFRLTTVAAAELNADTLTINGVTFTFVGGAPANALQIQSDNNATIVAGRIVTAVNNVLGANRAANLGGVVSFPNAFSVTYTDNGTAAPAGTGVIDGFGSPMTYTLIANPVGASLSVDNTGSPLGVDGRGTPLTYDLPGSTLTLVTTPFVTSIVSKNRVTIRSAPGISVPGGSTLMVSGGTGVTPGRSLVPVFADMTANQVAVAIRQSLADFWSNGDLTNIKGHENLINIIGHPVENAGPLGLTAVLPGDAFGAFNAGFVNGQATRPGSLRGMNNAVEGVYIDDIIIGFAERGEMVTNAPATSAFVQNHDVYNPNFPVGYNYLGIADGAYDVEIRRASDFGVSQTPQPTNILYRSLDTNDREINGYAFTPPAANQIPHNSTFVISDGWREVIFQFIDSGIGLSDLLPGNVPVVYNPLTSLSGTSQDSQEQIAGAILNAINSQAAQNVLQTQAMFSNTPVSGVSRTLHLTGNGTLTMDLSLQPVMIITEYTTYGDQNHFRDQGQIIVQSSTVAHSANFGINVDAAVRGGLNPTPHPGAVKNTQEINTARLVTGVVIMNNVIASNASGGVRFSGDAANNPFAAVPYGRIVNNTIVGIGSGVGILVTDNASPTMLNNIVADLGTGIQVDASSQAAGTVIGATLYRGNTTNTATGIIGAGTFPIFLTAGDPLFVDQANDNYYLAPFSQAIDSSLNSLGDRSDVTRVKSPLGLGLSPILAPSLDVYGQLRGDDEAVATPAGQGANVFIDRGAIDRVDFFQPTAILVLPEDQSANDLDSNLNSVWSDGATNLRQFRVRLVDEGIGISHATVSTEQFVLERDGVVLIEGTDYIFTYNSITGEAIFSAVTFFPFESRYTITVDNDDATSGDEDGVDGVRDLAGNYLSANEPDGTTQFRIVVTDGVNDPPVNTVPDSQTIAEDTPLVFSVANGNMIAVSDADVQLGDNRLQVTLTAVNGVLTLATLNGILMIDGTGSGDVTMTFSGDVNDLNVALNGLVFTPDADYFGSASVTITTDDGGQFAAPGSPVMTDTDVIAIDVTSVNDPPVFDDLTNPAAIPEPDDATVVFIPGFMTGQSAGPANEPQALTASVQVLSTTGAWTPATFFTPTGSPQIDPITGALTFEVARDVNGTATVRVVLIDSELAESAPQTFDIVVTPINDAPVFTLAAAASAIVSDEDAGLQSVAIIQSSAAARATALDELTGQNLTWLLGAPTVISGNLTFDVLEMLPDGTLRYQAAADTAGTVTVSLSLMDDGSGVFPNVNLSAAETLTIEVIQINDAPVASTPDYILDAGYSLTLDASASYDVDAFFGDTLSYSWDLNGDGTYDLTTSNPITVISWNGLQSYGITAPAVYNIRLQVTDSFGPLSDEDTGTLTTLIVDYGDAPNTYGTTKLADGAAHTINGTLFLGNGVDSEFDGVPTADATGDDLAGIDDEDGVSFPTAFETTAGQALPTFFLVTASQAGKLDVWLDFNQNGVFDAGDKLNGGVSYDVVAGVNRIDFLIPASNPLGTTFMRFRLSSAGGLSPTGRADDGEVEDYQVTIRELQAPVSPNIIKPVDVNLTDGQMAETSDLTPILEWSSHDSNYYYDVLVTNSSGATVFSQNAVTTTSTEVTPLLSAGIYTVTVTAYNRAGVAAAPSTYQFRVVPLNVVSPVNLSKVSNTYRPQITWNPVYGTRTYHVQIVTGPSNTIVHSGTVTDASNPPNAGTTYTVPVDLAIGTYRVRVRAIDGADLAGDWSPFSQFVVDTPTVITAPVGTTQNPRPTITWNPIPGAVSYTVQVNNRTDQIGGVILVSGIAGTSYTPTVDLSLANYEVWVVGFDANGVRSQWSPNGATFIVAPQPTAIVPNGRLNDSTPTFGWNAMPGADTYDLFVRNSSGALVVSQLNLPTTSFTLPTELPLGQYTYQIQATNLPRNAAGGAAVKSALSQNYSFLQAAGPTIVAPQTTSFSSHPEIRWNKPAGAGNSEIFIREVGGEQQFLVVNNVPGTSYIPNERVFGIGTYIVWVRSVIEDMNPALPLAQRMSDWSTPVTFRVATPPVNLLPAGRIANGNRPTLTWEGVPGAVSYELWVNNESAPVAQAVLLSGLNALNYTPPADLPIGRYVFWVRARNAFGTYSNWSAGSRFEIATPPVLSGPPASTFSTTPTFTWNNQVETLKGVTTGAERYDFVIYRVDPATGRYVFHRSAFGLTSPTYTHSIPLPEGRYRTWVRSIVPHRPSSGVPGTATDWSLPLDFLVGGPPTVSPIPDTTNTRPTITWQGVGAASGYEIYISLAATPSVPVVRVDNIGLTTFTVQNPLAKGEYRVWVRAISSINGSRSGWSTPVNMNIVETLPTLPAPDLQLANLPVATSTEQVDLHHLVSESTISMLPSMIYSGDAWMVADSVSDPDVVIPPTEADSDFLGSKAPVDAVLSVIEVDQEDATDSVLSVWDEQLWWDQAVKNDKQDQEEQHSASAGILGALFALTPRSLKRRKSGKSERNE